VIGDEMRCFDVMDVVYIDGVFEDVMAQADEKYEDKRLEGEVVPSNTNIINTNTYPQESLRTLNLLVQ
jgi:hypothetical protein